MESGALRRRALSEHRQRAAAVEQGATKVERRWEPGNEARAEGGQSKAVSG